MIFINPFFKQQQQQQPCNKKIFKLHTVWRYQREVKLLCQSNWKIIGEYLSTKDVTKIIIYGQVFYSNTYSHVHVSS